MIWVVGGDDRVASATEELGHLGLHRGLDDQLGAQPAAVEFLTLTEPGGRTTVVRHYFRADVLDLDPDRRDGPELDDPDTGDFSTVHVAPEASALRALELQPPELAAYLYEHAEDWRT